MAGLIKNFVDFVGVDDDTALIIADKLSQTGNTPAAIQQLIDSGTISREIGETILRHLERYGTGSAIAGAVSPLIADQD